ncbi:uncharacterized protein LOC112574650 [Pomacea canaliculata]|uniref:uncharacterized protein LOC112574650 n=1 Tax=Pomacea canaliculata TaxID=400727 RepID=UPI000D738071|nr:uncharacterized protein LOC112574650 [Pomacea canaliculata]XP_025111641.1 uncharacterized protein LOC112574650 [Pomacea canaliculata]
MATKIKALQAWCRKMTEGYRDVDVKDFTVSWRDGLAFCAMIHRFRPDLIDFDSLSKENVFENNNLAFTMAEKELNIPAFLEAADMVALKTPDKLSIITYVSQYYNYLHALPQLGGPGVKGKVNAAASAGIKRHQKAEPLTEPETKKITHNRDTTTGEVTKAKSSSVGDKCSICGNKVYLLERHVEGGQLYHRSCYRHSDLSPTGKVFSRSPFLSPSLHEVKTPSVRAANKEVPPKSNELSRTFTVQDTSLSQNQNAANKTESKKSQVQKHLFSDGHQGGNQETEKTKSANSVDLKGALHGIHARSTPKKDELHGISSKDSHVNDALHGDTTLTVSQPNEARTIEKYINNMKSKEEVNEIKPSKRQLPLILQTPVDASSETAHSRPTTTMEGSRNISETKSSDLKSDTKPTLAPTATKAIGKANPVARPRYKKRLDSRKEEKMDFDEPVKQNLPSSSTPKPSPRLSSNAGKTTFSEKSFPLQNPFHQTLQSLPLCLPRLPHLSHLPTCLTRLHLQGKRPYLSRGQIMCTHQ